MKINTGLHSLLRVLAICGVLFVASCSSTPQPTGDTLISVSWVNPTPVMLSQVETKICGSKRPVSLEKLPAYAELAVQVNVTLVKNCRIQTTLIAGKEMISLEGVDLPSPVRKSPENEYNLRIQLKQGLPPVVTLEPARLTRIRLGNG